MNIAIRADSSIKIGTGHIMRCLSLAHVLKQTGATVSFVTRKLNGNISEIIEKSGFEVLLLSKPAKELPKDLPLYDRWLEVDLQTEIEQTSKALTQQGKDFQWLVVDHYALGRRWEMALKEHSKGIMVIDDLATREHSCDLLLDQNVLERDSNKYSSLIPEKCKRLLGPHYALLRKEFGPLHEKMNIKERTGSIKRLLIFFGGADFTNETLKALQAVKKLDEGLTVDVVLGTSNPRVADFTSSEDFPFAKFHVQTNKMVELMSQVDLALGAAGTASWERCCLGLPTVVTVVAENQLSIAEGLQEYGAAEYLGRAEDVLVADIVRSLKNLINKPEKVKAMAERAFTLVDGLGANRVLQVMKEIS